jgi:hypothetical protein
MAKLFVVKCPANGNPSGERKEDGKVSRRESAKEAKARNDRKERDGMRIGSTPSIWSSCPSCSFRVFALSCFRDERLFPFSRFRPFPLSRRVPFLVLALFLAVAAWLPIQAAERDNQPPRGFEALFNGRDLTGWKGLTADPRRRARMSEQQLAEAQARADQQMREHWKVLDGVLTYDGKGTNLCTARDFGDFELWVDWKIEPGGDSGIYLRGTPQVQIWDHADGSGGLYNNEKHPSRPIKKADRPPGEWNRFRITMIGDKVTVVLNDELVVDRVTMENYWERDKPIYPTGPIELQHHGDQLFFKNIFIRELNPKTQGTQR